MENKSVEKPMRVKEAAEFVGLAVSSLYGLCHRREIPFAKRGRMVYFWPSELASWIAEGRVRTKGEIEQEAKLRIRRASQ